MANPNIAAVGTHSTLSGDKDFLRKFLDVDDAIRHDKLEKLLPLVMNKGEARRVNLSEDPLLSVVIAYGKSKLAMELIERMPLENLKDGNFNDDTALHVAVARGDEMVVEALVKKNGGLLEVRNKQMEIPLHRAALFGQRRIFWKLVEHGSIPDARREGGATMLHCAVMGNAPELALEIARQYPEQKTSRNARAVMPLQLVVTIPEAFRSQLHLGPLESLIYEWIPLEERHVEELEELSVHKSSDLPYKDNECQQFVITSQRKFPPNYATLIDILKLAGTPVRWARIFVFNILKPLSTRIQYLELQKKNHKQTMELIAYLARDPSYWDFINKGRSRHDEGKISETPPDTNKILETLPSTSEIPRTPPPDTSKISETPPDPNKILETPPSTTEIPRTPPDTSRISESPPSTSEIPRTPPDMINEISRTPSGMSGISRTPPNMSKTSEKNVSPPKQEAETPHKDHREDSNKTRWDESPLTLGAKMGLHEFVKQILTVFPESAIYPDTKGMNVLQVAIQHGHEKIVEIIESMVCGSNPVLPSWLLSGIEEETKNTILHFAAEQTVTENYFVLQMQNELQWFERVKRLVPKDLEYSRNEEEKTALELFIEKHKKMVQDGKEQLMEMGKTCSGLVAAVVFASSFSIPGDKDENHNPIFRHRTAFKVFSHAYVIGLSCAATALVLFLSLLTSPYRVQDFRRSLPTKYFFANASFFLALVALLVAFTCNIYLNIYGGKKTQTEDLVPFVCELTIFPVVCTFVLLYRGSNFGFGSFLRHVWR